MVKRYDFEAEWGYGMAVESADGFYVTNDDYAALQARISELEAKEKEFDWMNGLRHKAEARVKQLEATMDAVLALIDAAPLAMVYDLMHICRETRHD